MLETIIGIVQQVPWYWILLIAAFVTFLENIFPPSPSDTVLIFIGSLIPLNAVDFIPLLISATIGSTAGFIVMFWLGYKFGIKIVDSNRFKFINSETLKKPEEWFRKWGYLIIVVNRFLSGTRAVISFFAGMSKLNFNKTTFFCFISALLWNAILISLGVFFGNNWELADYYITLYGWIIFPILAIVIAYFLVRWILSIIKQGKQSQ